MNQYVAESLSRKDIRNYVNQIKKVTGIASMTYINILAFLENILQIFIPELQIEVVNEYEMLGKYAETFPDQRLIRIRQDVYTRAAQGSVRDRFTIAHEIGHLLLHDEDSISLCRADTKCYSFATVVFTLRIYLLFFKRGYYAVFLLSPKRNNSLI